MRVRSLLLALLLAACGDNEPAPLSAVLITVDTTNPGALDLYGKDRGLTPNLVTLAEESLVFDAAWSVAPLTLPSHSSMMTGLYPPRHGVRDNGLMPLPQSAQTLAERASAAGYETAAVVAAVVLGRAYGLDQGFDVYDEPEGRGQTVFEHMVERDADAVTHAAQTWLGQRDPERPFFLWVHYFDPHAPYEPPAPYLRMARGQAYLGEVAHMDAAIGRLIETLEGEVGLDQLVLCLAADHGESLGRHGEETHSVLCYDATQRVPLLVRHPEGQGAGQRSDLTASVVDVYPTLLELTGLGQARDVDGHNLFGPMPPDRGVYLESYCGYLNYGWSPLAGWVQGGRKYLHSSRPELYDLVQDSGERNNLFPGAPEEAADLRRRMEELLALPALERGASDGDVGDVQAQMQALGYAGAASATTEIPHPLTPTERPAPATRTDELARFYEAGLMAAEGRRREAIAALEEVIAENPHNVYARGTVSGLLIEERRHDEALPIVASLLDEGHDRVTLRVQMADCLIALDREQEALEHLERALELQPKHALARSRLTDLQRRLGSLPGQGSRER